MALIGKIQSNRFLLVGVVMIAMLAFIFTDFMKGDTGEYEQLPTGSAYGEPIDEAEYQELKDIYVNRAKQTAGMQGREATEQEIQKGEDDAFNEVIRRTLMNREFDALGIKCTSAELNDMITGKHIHPWVADIQLFQDPLGQFSRDSVQNFLLRLEPENEPEDPEAKEQWLLAREQWITFEKELKDTRTADKYVTLVNKGLYVNSLEAKNQYYNSYEKKVIKFVLQKYVDIPEDEVKVTEEDIKAYFEEHKHEKRYEQKEEARDLDHIVFDILPTEEDQKILMADMEKLKGKFEKSNNNIQFIANNSVMEQPFYSDSNMFSMGPNLMINPMMQSFFYPEVADEAIQAADSGDVIGPFVSVDTTLNKTEMFIAKVTGIEREEMAWVRHILIKVDNIQTDDIAKAKADSIVEVIKQNNNFAEMVQLSDDINSIPQGGQYKWFSRGRMVAEFEKASFEGAIGDLQIAKTNYGYHIVEVLGRENRVKPRLAMVVKPVVPSQTTIDYRKEQIFEFIYDVKESDRDSAFYKISQDSGMIVQSSRVWMSNSYVVGFDNKDRVLGFAFKKDVEEGDISDPILDGNTFKVVYMANIIEKGEPKFEDVKEQMRFPALKDKQAKVYIEKMSGKTTLEEVGKVITNPLILTSEVSFGSNAIMGGGGLEPEVIGKLFTNIHTGQMTVPIQGRAGVYVCYIESEISAPETSDYSLQQTNMRVARAGSADNLVIRALREKADVEDNRKKIKYQNG